MRRDGPGALCENPDGEIGVNFTLDENMVKRTLQVFKTAGPNVTIREQGFGGCRDQFYDHCRQEESCLVALDLDFSNILRFSPEPAAGIALFRPHQKTDPDTPGTTRANSSWPCLKNQLPDVDGLSNKTEYASPKQRINILSDDAA
jgi:hypothetical protein